MLDIKWIRENPKEFDRLIKMRGYEPLSSKILNLDEERRQLITLIQQLQHARKEKSKALGYLKDKSPKDFENAKKDVHDLKEKIDQLNNKLSEDMELENLLDSLPNLPDEEVPFGLDESSNKELKKTGNIKFVPKAMEHFEIGENLNMMDFQQTAKISGSRFVTLKGDLALMERALINFMIDIHTKEFGFLEISPPYIVRESAMYGVGQLPKFADDSFLTTDGFRLIPTSEVTLVNMVSDMILNRDELPMRLVAHSPCFRSEAGSAGKDTRGMIRLHQFHKVELVSITTPDQSDFEHEYMLNAAETILKRLDIPYRVMLLCSGDMGFSAKKTYDIEVWLPGQRKYREISSCSNCGDFQARRMKARYKETQDSDTIFVHTLNGSGLAVGRTMVAILENYLNEDGSVTVPDILVDYMGGIDRIEPMKF